MASGLVTIALLLSVAVGAVLSWTLQELEDELEDDLFQNFKRQHPIGLPCKGVEFICDTLSTATCCNGYCNYKPCEEVDPRPPVEPVEPVTRVPGNKKIPTQQECQTLINVGVCSTWECQKADDTCQECKENYGSILNWDPTH